MVKKQVIIVRVIFILIILFLKEGEHLAGLDLWRVFEIRGDCDWLASFYLNVFVFLRPSDTTLSPSQS